MTQPRRTALFDRTTQTHGRRTSEFIRIRRANLQGFVCIGSPHKAFTDERKWNESSTERAFSVCGRLKYTAGEQLPVQLKNREIRASSRQEWNEKPNAGNAPSL